MRGQRGPGERNFCGNVKRRHEMTQVGREMPLLSGWPTAEGFRKAGCVFQLCVFSSVEGRAKSQKRI